MDLWLVFVIGFLAVIAGVVVYAMQATALPSGGDTVQVPASYDPNPLLFLVRAIVTCRVRGAPKRSEPVPKLPAIELRREVSLDKYEAFHRHFVTDETLVDGPVALLATYPSVAGAALGIASLVHPKNPLPILPTPVHVRQRIELLQDRLVEKGGAAFEVVARPDRIVPTESGWEMHIDFDAVDKATGEVFSRATTVALYKFGGKRPKSKDKAADAAKAAVAPDVAALARRDAASAEADETWEVPSGLGVEYAKLSGDFNPIHTSPLAARFMMGFKGAIIHGFWTLTKCCAALRRKGLASSRGTFLECSFRSPLVMPGRAHFGVWPVTAEEGGKASMTAREGDATTHEFAVWGPPRKRYGMTDADKPFPNDVYCHGTVGTLSE